MADEYLKQLNSGRSKSPAGAILREMLDEATAQAGSNRSSNEGEEAEILVKWQINGDNDISAAKRTLIQTMATLLVAFPKRITITDRRQQEWEYDETINEDQYRQQIANMAVQLHPIKNKDQKVIRWVTITKIRTDTTLQDWKNDDDFHTQAKESKVYTFPHPFGYDDWDVVSIGFIKNHHAVHYPQSYLQEKLHKLLSDQSTTTPVFQLIPQRVTTQDKKASTKAFTVQCLKKHADQLLHSLTHGQFRQPSNQIFVPFRYKSKQPGLFLQCIRQQNEIYHKTWIIKLEGITNEAMQLLEEDILRINGTLHVVPSKKNAMTGEWKLLVEQTKCSYIHRTLTKVWKDLVSVVPSEIWEKAPPNFPIPSVSSRKVREYQDTDSDIDSYGSLLTVGTESPTNAAEESSPLDDLPSAYQYPTYASVVASVECHASTESTQISSPNTSSYLDWQKEKTELENKLQEQARRFEQELENRFQKYTTLIEQLQSEIQEKVTRSQDLEDKLAQALDLAYDRDARHEEMTEKVEMLLRMQKKEPPVDAIVPTMPSTPVRVNPSPSSPPTKRKNMNATPHRSMYNIFQNHKNQPKGVNSTTNHTTSKNLKHPPHSNETSMDIDAEQDNMPLPEAQAGNNEKC